MSRPNPMGERLRDDESSLEFLVAENRTFNLYFKLAGRCRYKAFWVIISQAFYFSNNLISFFGCVIGLIERINIQQQSARGKLFYQGFDFICCNI